MSRRRRRPRVPPTFHDRINRVVAVASEHTEPDGGVYSRATSHTGYNGSDNPAIDWASDLGGELPRAAQVRDEAEAIGLRDRGGWTRSQGTYYVSGGIHAGHATEGSLARELAGLMATDALALTADPIRGPNGAAQERHRQELLALRLRTALFGPGARTTPPRLRSRGAPRNRPRRRRRARCRCRP